MVLKKNSIEYESVVQIARQLINEQPQNFLGQLLLSDDFAYAFVYLPMYSSYDPDYFHRMIGGFVNAKNQKCYYALCLSYEKEIRAEFPILKFHKDDETLVIDSEMRLLFKNFVDEDTLVFNESLDWVVFHSDFMPAVTVAFKNRNDIDLLRTLFGEFLVSRSELLSQMEFGLPEEYMAKFLEKIYPRVLDSNDDLLGY